MGYNARNDEIRDGVFRSQQFIFFLDSQERVRCSRRPHPVSSRQVVGRNVGCSRADRCPRERRDITQSYMRQHQRDPKAQGRGEGEENGGPGHWDIPIGSSFLWC
jgi:hypothetical protein